MGIAVVHPTHGLVGGLGVAIPEARSNASVEREHAGLLRVAAARLLATMR